MYNIRIGQVIYGYNNKYELYYKLSKNFYLKYQKYFKNLQVSNSNNKETISVPFINGVKFHFDISEQKTDEWKRVIKTIQEDETNKLNISPNVVSKEDLKIVSIPLRDAYERNSSKLSSYKKLFPNYFYCEMIADFVTAVQSTSISEGVKLENYIYDEFKGQKYENITFENAIDIIKYWPERTILFKKVKITKKMLNENTTYEHKRSEKLHLDLLILHEGDLYIDELKDGMSLDTKKSDSEIREIKMVKELCENKTNLKCHSSIILWTCKDISNASIKSDEASDYILTGRNLCRTLNINFDSVEFKRRLANEGNGEYAIEKLKQIIEEYKKEK
jgi:hypothetical protein